MQNCCMKARNRRHRNAVRDAGDWPVLACAMTLGCPVWIEGEGFFGTGVPSSTSDRIAVCVV